MENSNRDKYNSISMITAILVCTGLYAVLTYFFDFYYDLNDDVLIADILSGAYGGSPDAHNIQMLYPLAWCYKQLYSLKQNFPWFGASQIAAGWFCLVLIFARTQQLICEHTESRIRRVLMVVAMYVCSILFIFGTNLWEMVMLQYTVTCGLMAATAAYLVFTSETFTIGDNIVSVVLVILAFNMRSEMLLLLCPYLAAVGICKWLSEGFSWKVSRKYLAFLGLIAAGMAASFFINAYAYSSDEWREFTRLFDARTQVYDFTGIPDYEDNKDFYDTEYVLKYDYDRLTDYNYVLSDRVNAQLLEDVAEYATEHRTYERSVPWALFENIKDTLTWTTPGGRNELVTLESAFYEDNVKLHIPYNMIVIILYAAAVVGAILTKDVRWAYTLPVLFVMRTIAWGYIVYRGRVNARIAHPLYLTESMILIAMLLMAWIESDYMSVKVKKITTWMLLLGLGLATAVSTVFIPSTVRHDLVEKAKQREKNNIVAEQIYSYTASNPRNYYLIDVYSTVGFTQEVFPDSVYTKANTQLAGGWAAFSPIDDYKRSHYPKENQYFISVGEYDCEYDVEETIELDGCDSDMYVYRLNQ